MSIWQTLILSALAFAPPTTSTPAPKPSAPTAPAAAPAPQAQAQAKTAVDIVKGVQAYYQSTERLEAKFKQKFTNVVFGKTSESHGKVFIVKPGKMRWDYTSPVQKFFISDGKTLWIYEPTHKQAFQQDLKDQVLPVAVTFLYGQGDLLKDFTPSLDPGAGLGGKDSYVVKLVPKQPSGQYKHLWLVVDPRDFHVQQSVILEASDNRNEFRFYDIKQNSQVSFQDKHFKFKPPRGVKIVQPPAARPTP